jgi:citrate lyase subunit beta/citryl-CoA lyase
MLGKGPGIPADMVFLDLETRCAPKEKEARADKVVAAIRDQDWGEKVLCVRVNDWSTKWTAIDVMAVVGGAARLDEIMLPKVETAAQSWPWTCCWPGRAGGRAAGRPHRHRGQIETTLGLINVEASARPRPGWRRSSSARRLRASMEMPVLTGACRSRLPGDHFHYVFSKILMAGRANGSR